MLSTRTKCRIGAGLGAGCAAIGLALLTAPSSLAGSGCANASADIGVLSKGQTRAAITCLFNNTRSSGNLDQNGDLVRAAQRHSNTMASEQCFSHDCPGEPDLKQRVKNTGYFNGAGQVGEIIAFGPPDDSPSAYVNEWLNSAAHRNEIKKPAYRDVGVGINITAGDVFLTAVFGKP